MKWCDKTWFERIHLATKQDMRNVSRSFGLNKIQKHSDDATSLAAMIAEMERTKDSTSVLFSKFQESVSGLNDDIMLVIQTSIQVQMFTAFAPGHVVCM